MTSNNVTEAETVEPSEAVVPTSMDDRLIDELVRADQGAHLAQSRQALTVRGVGDLGRVQVRQHGNLDVHGGCFAQDAQREFVGDPGGPLIDGVEAGRSDRDRNRRPSRTRFSR